MNEPFISRIPSHHLDPGAQEFFPSLPPQIFLPYPPPPYDSMIGYGRPPFSSVPAFVSAAAEPPPPPQLPVFVPPSSATPSRTLLLSMVPASVSESTVRRELEVFGDVRAVQMERRREGLVTVHFYDVRDAQAALGAIQEQHMQQQFRIGRHYDAVLNSSHAFMSVSPPPPLPQTARGLIAGRVVWAQFTTPVTSGLPDGNNQGTLILFNLDPRVSPSYLREIFESFGPVKELRETPYKRNQRFVEFYDVRNAAMAMSEMNGRLIYGKPIVIEFSRPGGQAKKFWKGGPDQNNGASSKSNLRRSPTRENKPFFRQTPPQRRNDDYRRNGNGSDGSKSWSSGSSSLHGSMANLSVNNSGYHDECSNSSNNTSKYAQKKKDQYFKKVNNNNSSASDSGGGGGGCGTVSKQHWKGGGGGGGGGTRRGRDDHDPRFLINEDAIVESNCRDTRTTVMIKNIPNKYSQKLLLNMLDNHCIHCNEQIADGDDDDQPLSSYDFLYLPIDFINKCNVGYGFVNMTSPEATIRLYKAFHHQNWEVFNSRKICQVTYARLQGLEALREHFKNSKFPGEAEEYMPVIFSPPRDGLTLPDPVPIVCRPVAGDSCPSPSSAGSSTKDTQTQPQVLINGSYYEAAEEGVAGGAAGKGGSGSDD